jgi:hypothetical protein
MNDTMGQLPYRSGFKYYDDLGPTSPTIKQANHFITLDCILLQGGSKTLRLWAEAALPPLIPHGRHYDYLQYPAVPTTTSATGCS